MKLVIGLVVVAACVLGGFVLHHGNLMALFVPTEYLIIVGCLVGGMIARNPASVLQCIGADTIALLKGAGPTRAHYVELLQTLYTVFLVARKDGLLALESHANAPQESSILAKHESFAGDHHAVSFLCDSLKLFIGGNVDPHRFDDLMERDLDALHEEEMAPSEALSNAAHSLPAIGIVAAVLGIILTMSAIDEGAASVGRRVAGALVGTFLGVFLAYGFVAPTAGALERLAQARSRYYQCIRHTFAAFVSGATPAMAVEFGRRGLHTADRPSFDELEEALRHAKD